MKKVKFVAICCALSIAASSQVNLDSVRVQILKMKYGLSVVSQSGAQVPPPGSFIHCELSCKDRQMFEKIDNNQWSMLMRENSVIGLRTIALLYDLFKKNCMLFWHVENKIPGEWESTYWKAEIKEWESFLKQNIYRYKKDDCW